MTTATQSPIVEVMSNSTFRIPTKEEVIAKFNAALLLECATEAHSLGRHANSNQFIDFCPTCQSEAAAR